MATRSRNAARSRTQIVEAATTEFANRGVEGARMDTIAARAGCDKRLLYHYFDGKHDLYRAVVESDLAKLEKTIDGLDEIDDPEEQIRQFIQRYLDFLTDETAHARLTIQQELMQSAGNEGSGREIRGRIFAFLSDAISRGQEKRVFKSDLDPGRTVLSVWAACMHPYTLRDTLAEVSGTSTDVHAEALRQKEHVTGFVLGALRASGGEHAV